MTWKISTLIQANLNKISFQNPSDFLHRFENLAYEKQYKKCRFFTYSNHSVFLFSKSERTFLRVSLRFEQFFL